MAKDPGEDLFLPNLPRIAAVFLVLALVGIVIGSFGGSELPLGPERGRLGAALAAATATSVPLEPTPPPPTPSPTATPLPPTATPTPNPVGKRAVVFNTEGQGLLMRSDPTPAGSRIIVTLLDGTEVTVEEVTTQGNVLWYRVRWGTFSGWSRADYLALTP